MLNISQRAHCCQNRKAWNLTVYSQFDLHSEVRFSPKSRRGACVRPFLWADVCLLWKYIWRVYVELCLCLRTVALSVLETETLTCPRGSTWNSTFLLPCTSHLMVRGQRGWHPHRHPALVLGFGWGASLSPLPSLGHLCS